MTDEQLREAVARAICREKCAFMGEPPCFTVMDGSEFAFPPETCCEPGCMAEADAAIALMRPVIRATALEEAAKVADRAVIPMCETSADRIAAAIRALKEKPNG